MGIVAKQLTKRLTVARFCPSAFENPPLREGDVGEIVRRVAAVIAANSAYTTSSTFRGKDYSLIASSISAIPSSIVVENSEEGLWSAALGASTVEFKSRTYQRANDWKLVVRTVDAQSDTAGVMVETPYYLTSNGELANKIKYKLTRQAIEDCVTNGVIPVADHDVAGGMMAMGEASPLFNMPFALPFRSQFDITTTLNADDVARCFDRLPFYRSGSVDQAKWLIRRDGKSSIRASIEIGDSSTVVHFEADLHAGSTDLDSAVIALKAVRLCSMVWQGIHGAAPGESQIEPNPLVPNA